MPDKFGRGYILTIEPAFDYVSGNPLSPDDSAVVSIADPITIDFSIRRDTLASSNTATFRIYNLSEKTRNRLYKDKHTDWQFMPITFQAGYGTPLPIIFKGNVMEAKSYRAEGSTDFITEISAYDMGFAMANSYSSKSFPGGTKKSDVVEYLIGDMKKYGVSRGAVTDYSAASYARQRVIMGSTWEALQTEAGGSKCFIDNGRVNILKDGEGGITEAIEADIPLLDSDTGLLGSPAKSEYSVVADILFEPKLTVGQLVDLESKSSSRFNGQRQVIGLQHTGIISGAVNGKCRTRVTMLYNVGGFKTISAFLNK